MTPFLSQKTVSVTSSADCALSDFFFPSGCFMVPFGQNCHYVALTGGWGGGDFFVLRHSPYIRIVYMADVIRH
jgi:hypothetical protein